MIREIITIDEHKCTGCGLCIPNCPEGALQVIDGKARLINDLFCDGLGACIGNCPEGAITIEKREAEPYNERKVMANIVRQGDGTIAAHLKHLEDHGEKALLAEAKAFLQEQGIELPTVGAAPASADPAGEIDTAAACPAAATAATPEDSAAAPQGGCPGTRFRALRPGGEAPQAANAKEPAPASPSRLSQWPVQLHLIPAGAPWLENKDLLLCADCVGYAVGDFHNKYLEGKALAIACPKLDSGQDVYLHKLTALIENAKVRSIEVLMMQVPCCHGLLRLVQQAAEAAGRRVPVKYSVISVEGEILQTAEVS